MKRFTRILTAGQSIEIPAATAKLRLGAWAPGAVGRWINGSGYGTFSSGGGAGWSELSYADPLSAALQLSFGTGIDGGGSFARWMAAGSLIVKASTGDNVAVGIGVIRYRGGNGFSAVDNFSGATGGSAAGTLGNGTDGDYGPGAGPAPGPSEIFTDSVNGLVVTAGRGGGSANSGAGESAGGGGGAPQNTYGSTAPIAGGAAYGIVQFDVDDAALIQPLLILI